MHNCLFNFLALWWWWDASDLAFSSFWTCLNHTQRILCQKCSEKWDAFRKKSWKQEIHSKHVGSCVNYFCPSLECVVWPGLLWLIPSCHLCCFHRFLQAWQKWHLPITFRSINAAAHITSGSNLSHSCSGLSFIWPHSYKAKIWWNEWNSALFLGVEIWEVIKKKCASHIQSQ